MPLRLERFLLPALLLVMGILMLHEGNRIAAREMVIARDPREVQARVTQVEARFSRSAYTLHLDYTFETVLPDGQRREISGKTQVSRDNRHAIRPGDHVAIVYSGLRPSTHRLVEWADGVRISNLILRVTGGLMLAAFFVVVALMLRT